MNAATAYAQSNLSEDVAANTGNGSTDKNATTTKEDNPCIPLRDDRLCYMLDPLTGLRHCCEPDTSFIGLGNRQTMNSHALSVLHTGNNFSPHLVQAFFDRRDDHDFIFANAYNLFRTDPSQQLYYNTKVPLTVINFTKSGSSIQENDRLRLSFMGNFNRQTGIGSQLDYVYARGEYMNSATKPLRWTSYAYYEGDQYKAYINFNLSKLANQENGGITDRGMVLNPDTFNSNFTDPRNMPTRLTDTWNETDTRQLHFQHSYDFGMWQERIDPADSSVYDEFIPVASIFHNIDIESMHHNFVMGKSAQAKDDPFFADNWYDPLETHDSTSYRCISTYAGLRLNEGFSRFSQFAISGFIGFEHQQYTMLQDSLDLKYIPRSHSSNNVWVGGQISRQQSSDIRFDATAKTCISDGDKLGDVMVDGTIYTTIPFGRRDAETGRRTDSLLVTLGAKVRNTHTPYLLQHYFSNHFRWSNSKFKAEKHVRVDGTIAYPRTGTSIRGGIEHISDFHYFDNTGMPRQFGQQIDVFAIEARQGLHAGKWLSWENAVLVQISSKSKVLNLPTVSVESDLSFRFRIAKTLLIQAGVTGYYNTRYYVPVYQPATQQFCVQRDIKCGNYPMLNGYVNCNLKRIKFFLAMHNLLDGAVTNDSFIMPYYPAQTRRMEMGVILDLQN
ncbi:MAG: putative porin [Bacteroidales bacterium]|nr:putative porin [Candidatus Liminaster caballi]